MPRPMKATLAVVWLLTFSVVAATEARADRTIGNFDPVSGLYTYTASTDLNDVPGLASMIQKFPGDPAPYSNIPFVTTNVDPVLEISKFVPSQFGVTAAELVRVEVWFSGVVRTGGANSRATIFTPSTTLDVFVDDPHLRATLPGSEIIPIEMDDVHYGPITAQGTTPLPAMFRTAGSQPSEPLIGLGSMGTGLPQLVYNASDPGGIPLDFFGTTIGEKLDVPTMAAAFSRYVSTGTGNGFAIVQTLVSPKLTIRFLFVPEPSSVALIGLGLAVFGVAALRRRRATPPTDRAS